MTAPDEQQPPLSLAEVASETPEESVQREHELVDADQPDTGGLVPPDSSQ